MLSAAARLAPAVLLVALAGCSPHRTIALNPQAEPAATASPSPSITDTPTASAEPTDTVEPTATDNPSVSPSAEPGSLVDGKHPANITTVDVADRKLTIDVVQFFTGSAAAEAAREDGASEVPPPNDYWIRNANKLLRTLPVAADATITVNTLAGETSGNSAEDVTVSLEQLAGYDLANHLFWLTVEGGTITRIAEQFLP